MTVVSWVAESIEDEDISRSVWHGLVLRVRAEFSQVHRLLEASGPSPELEAKVLTQKVCLAGALPSV